MNTTLTPRPRKVFRESGQEQGWVQTYLPHLLRELGQTPALDELRVTEAMHYGWRWSELRPPKDEQYIGALQTSSWFSINGDAMAGVLLGADPEFDELPPLPFARMAIDGWDPKKDQYMPVFAFEIPTSGEPVVVDPNERMNPEMAQFGLASMVIFEIEQGLLWDVIVEVRPLTPLALTASRSPRVYMAFHVTPNGHTADYEKLAEVWSEAALDFDRAFGLAVWKAAVSAVHMVTATNVRNRRILPHRKQLREWGRQKYRPLEPTIYRVDIVSTTHRLHIGGAGDREYHFRWMVRGHYRHTPHGEYRHPLDGSPASWVRAHVKGPAGAPWKGRGHYIRKVAS